MKPALAPLLLGLAVGSCEYRPPLYADRPVVTEIADDAPIALPRRTAFLQEVYIYEVYLRRALVFTLDPLRVPVAGDVNALDEVPRSSWFEPRALAAGETQDGPPVPPFTVLAERPDGGHALAVTDARGLRYELRGDTFDHPEMHTGAAAVGSRLMRALGYRAAEAEVIDVTRAQLVATPGATFEDVLAESRPPAPPAQARGRGRDTVIPAPARPAAPPEPATREAEHLRMVAVRWPLGLDLGPPSAFATRADDPNDQLLPGDRRTLRALGAVGAFLGLKRWDARVLRDAYAGEPGSGHVLHYVVTLDGALGAGAVPNPDEADDDPRAWLRLVALGLAPKRPPSNLEHPSLGVFPDVIGRDAYAPQPPYEPVDRARPEDLYWAARRIAALGPRELDAAVAAGQFSDPFVKAAVRRSLDWRRERVIASGFAGVTPCEVSRYERGWLELTDQARRFGVGPLGVTRYRAEFADAEGRTVAPPLDVVSEEPAVRIPLPPAAGDYLVVRVWTERQGSRTQRPLEVHFALGSGTARLLAVRHGT